MSFTRSAEGAKSLPPRDGSLFEEQSLDKDHGIAGNNI
jgi:hypothetical protein